MKASKPNLFIVGAAKCGTTAWVDYLKTHPDIYFSEVKEPHFFATDLPKKRYVKSVEDYEKLFENDKGARHVGEGSVFQLYSREAARNIHEYNPDARIIIFIRDQGEFLLSLHHQFLWVFTENIEDFEQAWRVSDKRDPKSISKYCPDPKLLNYAAQGRFYEQIRRYAELFPPGHIYVCQFQDWAGDPRSAYLRILDFLGLEDDGRTEFPRVNAAKAHRYRWLGRMIIRRPQFTELIAQPLRKLMRRRYLHIAERASMLFATRGYKTRLKPELRDEIRRYYEAENRKLEALLQTLASARPQ